MFFLFKGSRKKIKSWEKQKSCGCIKNELIAKSRTGLVSGMKGKHHTKETRIKQSKSKIGKESPMKGRKRTEEQKCKMSEAQSGEKHWNWQGGKSFEEYPQEFFDIRKQIFERDNYICQCNDCEHKSIKLVIHHIDYNKSNNDSNNLITLCNKSHAKTYGKNKRFHWIEYYKNIMENKINV